ncbi:hypothetical protein [Domibacillus robiginosus]|uniref:hypothetical protein n=1 Tax=Domibacillus robiginosus TaxID=1071054 RepID=UPI00067D1394|nr:hypothetical protein [Domibacillus robiginosus]
MTVAESLLALTALLIAAGTLLPFSLHLIEGTSWRWEQQEGMRKLYEEAESRIYSEASFSYELDHPNFSGKMGWEESEGKASACVESRGEKRCVVEQ